jgi:DNA-binding transcriptional ArsR family regulator
MATRKPKKKFKDIREIILKDLENGERTVNQIASATGLTWRTVDNHLIYLIGKALVEPVYVSKYVKIFRLREAEK